VGANLVNNNQTAASLYKKAMHDMVYGNKKAADTPRKTEHRRLIM
jgi:hypothetical protein